MKDNRPIPWGNPSQPRILSRQRAGLVIDLDRCTGCHACSVSCKTEHQVPLGHFRSRVRYLQAPGAQQLSFVPLACMHCQNAACISACEHKAIVRLADGRVHIDQDRCAGSGDCVEACPFGAIYIDAHTDTGKKCDLCLDRTSLGLDPACVNACANGAIQFADLDDPQDPATRYAKERGAQSFKPSAGVDPNVLYVGTAPWMEEAIKTGVQLSLEDGDITYEQAEGTQS